MADKASGQTTVFHADSRQPFSGNRTTPWPTAVINSNFPFPCLFSTLSVLRYCGTRYRAGGVVCRHRSGAGGIAIRQLPCSPGRHGGRSDVAGYSLAAETRVWPNASGDL